MNIPVVPEDLLEIGDYKVTYHDKNVLVVDDWYKNFDILHSLLQNIVLPRWKWSPTGRNFIDYYDCRPIINCNFADSRKIKKYFDEISNLILKYFPEKKIKVEVDLLRSHLLEFNFFKHMRKDVNAKYQHYPHTDYRFNCIVYIDKICSGGTAFYPEMTNENIRGLESENLLYDVSELKKNVIQSVPNRMILFDGKIFHGGYIENHNEYVDNWRINQVTLID